MQKASQDAPQTEVAASQIFHFFILLSILSRLYWLFNHNRPIVHPNLHLVPLNLTTGWGDSSVGRAFATPAEDLCLDSQNPRKKHVWASVYCNLSTGLDRDRRITGACWPAGYLKMFTEETYRGKEESSKTGHLMSSSSVLTSTHWYTLPSCRQYLRTHTHTHTPKPPQNKIKPPKPS